MSEEEVLSLNNYLEDLYQAMQIGDIVFESKRSSELYNLINKLLKENQELKNQQKEFIEYLENKISELNEITKNEEDEETIHYALVRITAINELIHEINKIRKEINNDD